ncbi:hypothetical protein [Pseudolysinimonas sp.]|uniref:hypothetical protein n=1 Tax=Pseudolysinimonas sp. TaxID=2680009 RepID=UPI003F81E5B1
MTWWNDLIDWARSEGGRTLILGAIIPFVAIIVGAIIGAVIGRSAVRRLVGQRDHETRASAVTALIQAGQDAAKWHSQSAAAKEHAAHLASEADVMVRLLPISGAGLAADWATHQLAEMRTNSVSYSYAADQTFAEYRDRLVLWLHKPGKAKKLFATDLQRWKYDDNGPDPLVVEQQKWAEEQVTATNHQAPEHAPSLPVGHGEPATTALPAAESAAR